MLAGLAAPDAALRMQFQIVSHACASLRQGRVQLVLDPWLIGPVYWGAWWHCPEPVYDEDIFRPDYVYITHWHIDHLHAESLRHFHADTHFLVPAFPVSILAQTLRDLGFRRITELSHGVPFELGPDFRITSWQIQYQDDSLCVIEGGGTVLVDLNDCKPLPRTWRKLRARYPSVDFMLRSHSPAWSYPSRYTFDDPSEAIPVSRESYMQAFRSAASLLRPRYAVPFASSVCHPHREVLSENGEMVTAAELEAYWRRHPLAGTELVLMQPGSRWDELHGFDRSGVVVRDVRAFVAEKAEQNRGWLEELYAREERATLRFETFERFFRGFLGSALLLARPFLGVVLVFHVEQDRETPYWAVHFRSGRIERLSAEPPRATSVISVPPAVLEDALATFTFTNIDISKRWRVAVRRGGVTKHLLAWVLISLYEAGYLSPRNLLRWRFVRGMFARRSEALDYLGMIFKLLTKGRNAAAEAVTEPA